MGTKREKINDRSIGNAQREILVPLWVVGVKYNAGAYLAIPLEINAAVAVAG